MYPKQQPKYLYHLSEAKDLAGPHLWCTLQSNGSHRRGDSLEGQRHGGRSVRFGGGIWPTGVLRFYQKGESMYVPLKKHKHYLSAKALQRYPTKELLIKLRLFGLKEF